MIGNQAHVVAPQGPVDEVRHEILPQQLIVPQRQHETPIAVVSSPLSFRRIATSARPSLVCIHRGLERFLQHLQLVSLFAPWAQMLFPRAQSGLGLLEALLESLMAMLSGSHDRLAVVTFLA